MACEIHLFFKGELLCSCLLRPDLTFSECLKLETVASDDAAEVTSRGLVSKEQAGRALCATVPRPDDLCLAFAL